MSRAVSYQGPISWGKKKFQSPSQVQPCLQENILLAFSPRQPCIVRQRVQIGGPEIQEGESVCILKADERIRGRADKGGC